MMTQEASVALAQSSLPGLSSDDAEHRTTAEPTEDLVAYLEPFDTFYRSAYGRVVAVAHSMTGDAHLGEEIAQEAFISAHRNWAKVSRLDRPDLWVRRVAINRCTSTWRRKVIELRVNRQAAAGRVESAHDTSDVVAARAALWDAVRDLPDRQTAVVVLHYVDDLSTAEIGELLGLSASTVQTHLTRARARLADVLSQNGSADSKGTPS